MFQEQINVGAEIWISRSSGLTLREELDIDACELGIYHSSLRTRSSGVQPPAGVN